MPIHIHSLLFLFISSVLIPLFAIVLNFSFPFILISTHPILSLLLCYPVSILQSIFLSILPHYSTPFSFILSFPFSIFSSSTHHSSHSFLYTSSSLSHSILIPSFILFHFNATVLSSSSSLFYIQLLDSILSFYCPLCSQTPFYYHSPHTSLFFSSIFIYATSIQFILFSPILSLTFY